MKLPPHTPSKDGSIILLAKRGECTFADKALNAQKAGASMIMYVDNTVEDVHKVLPFKESSFNGNIQIPSILLDNPSGNKLIDAVTMKQQQNLTDENVIIALDFPLGQKARSEVNLLISINSFESYTLLKDIFQKFDDLKLHMSMVPTYFVYRKSIPPNVPVLGTNDMKKPLDDMNFKLDTSEDCLKMSSFCARRLDGAAIEKPEDSPLREILKQMCVYQKGIDIWYSYITAFHDNCFEFDNVLKKQILVKNLSQCSENIPLDYTYTLEVEKCRQEIIKHEEPLTIPTVERNLKAIEFFHSDNVPAVVVNGSLLRVFSI